MKRELIKTLPYNEVKFRWISNHYDVHLNGTCMYNGDLCEFENKYPGYNEETDDCEEMFVKIYKLDLISKLNGIGNNGNLKNVLGIIGHILKENKVKVFIIESQNGYMCGYLIGTTNGSNFYYT